MRGLISAVMIAVMPPGVAGVAQAQAQAVRASYTVEPFSPSAQITIKGSGVRLRAEPFATRDTPVLSAGSTGLALNVVGIARQPDWNWYQVVLKNGQKAFIRSDFTSAPSQGGASAATAAHGAYVPTIPAPVTTITPPPTPPVYTPPVYTPPVYTPPVSVTPAPAPIPAPQPTDRPTLDLPKPGDSSGLISIAPSPPTPGQ